MLAGWWSSVIPEIEPPTATNMYSSFCGNNPVLKKWTDMKQNYLSNHISVVDNPILGPTQKKFGPTYEAHSSLQNPHKIENDMGKNTCIPQIVPKYLVSSLHPPCFWYFLIGAFFLISKKNRKGLYMISMAMPWLPKSMAFHGDSGACFELLRRFPGLRRALAVQTPVQWEPCGCAGGCDVQPVHVTSHIQYMCNLFAWSNMYTVTNYYYTTQKKQVNTNSRAFCLLAPRFSSRIHMLNKAWHPKSSPSLDDDQKISKSAATGSDYSNHSPKNELSRIYHHFQ